MNKRSFRIRIGLMILLVVTVFVLGCMRMMQFQIVEGAYYADQAESRTISRMSVKAPRGEIVDRDGEPLVINKTGFNISFQYIFMPEDSINTTILQLIQLMQEAGEEWIDNLPISKTKPYVFDEEQEAAIARVQEKLRLNVYATAENCVDAIIEKYEINELEGVDDYTKRLIAGVRYEMLATDFSTNIPYTFAEDVSMETASKIEELGFILPGVRIVEEPIREYVSEDLATHIIGQIGPIYQEEYQQLKEQGYQMNDVLGKSGIEKAMEEYLRGEDGTIRLEQNKRGDVLDEIVTKETKPGNTVRLTIDKDFQQQLKDILDRHIAYERTTQDGKNAKGGALVVLDVETGAVLGMESNPTYNINDYRKKYSELLQRENNPLFNRATEGLYRPGSTFKTVVATAALNEGIQTRTSTVFCNHTYTYYDDYQPQCLGWHRNTAVVHALEVSCNIYFYDTGRRLGINPIIDYAHKLGLGTQNKLEIGGATGAISSPDEAANAGVDWYPGDVLQTSIGQSYTAVTPLQMALQACTIANQGELLSPHLVEEVISYDQTETVLEKGREVVSSIDSDFYESVRDGMIAAAGQQSTLRGYDVAIKTGTPQVTTTKFNSAFIGFYPASNPKIAFAGIVEEGRASARMVHEIIDAYLSLESDDGTASGTSSDDSSSSSDASEPESSSQP